VFIDVELRFDYRVSNLKSSEILLLQGGFSSALLGIIHKMEHLVTITVPITFSFTSGRNNSLNFRDEIIVVTFAMLIMTPGMQRTIGMLFASHVSDLLSEETVRIIEELFCDITAIH